MQDQTYVADTWIFISPPLPKSKKSQPLSRKPGPVFAKQTPNQLTTKKQQIDQKALFPFAPKLLCEEALIGLIIFTEGVNTALCCMCFGNSSAGKIYSESGRAKAFINITFDGFTSKIPSNFVM